MTGQGAAYCPFDLGRTKAGLSKSYLLREFLCAQMTSRNPEKTDRAYCLPYMRGLDTAYKCRREHKRNKSADLERESNALRSSESSCARCSERYLSLHSRRAAGTEHRDRHHRRERCSNKCAPHCTEPYRGPNHQPHQAMRRIRPRPQPIRYRGTPQLVERPEFQV